MALVFAFNYCCGFCFSFQLFNNYWCGFCFCFQLLLWLLFLLSTILVAFVFAFNYCCGSCFCFQLLLWLFVFAFNYCREFCFFSNYCICFFSTIGSVFWQLLGTPVLSRIVCHKTKNTFLCTIFGSRSQSEFCLSVSSCAEMLIQMLSIRKTSSRNLSIGWLEILKTSICISWDHHKVSWNQSSVAILIQGIRLCRECPVKDS